LHADDLCDAEVLEPVQERVADVDVGGQAGVPTLQQYASTRDLAARTLSNGHKPSPATGSDAHNPQSAAAARVAQAAQKAQRQTKTLAHAG
jgi:hypothetical protein